MRRAANYFCPDDGWEGSEPTCPICSQPSEPLDVEERTAAARPQLEESEAAPELELVDDFAEEALPPEEREEEY